MKLIPAILTNRRKQQTRRQKTGTRSATSPSSSSFWLEVDSVELCVCVLLFCLGLCYTVIQRNSRPPVTTAFTMPMSQCENNNKYLRRAISLGTYATSSSLFHMRDRLALDPAVVRRENNLCAKKEHEHQFPSLKLQPSPQRPCELPPRPRLPITPEYLE